MIPPLGRFIQGFNFFAAAWRVTPLTTAGELDALRVEAQHLAAGDESSEPAALFHAVARRPALMAHLSGRYAERLARNQAAAAGLVLRASAEELDAMRLSIDLDELPFEPVREWFRARLAPAR